MCFNYLDSYNSIKFYYYHILKISRLIYHSYLLSQLFIIYYIYKS